MVIDSPTAENMEEVKLLFERFQKDKFVMPKVNTVLDHCVAIHQGKVIAYGLLKTTPEGLIILDKSQKMRVKIEALRELLHAAQMAVVKRGLDEMVIYTDDDLYANTLKKHYGFRDGQRALFLDL
jgi:hypothetical protein